MSSASGEFYRFYDVALCLSGPAAGNFSDYFLCAYSGFRCENREKLPRRVIHAHVEAKAERFTCTVAWGDNDRWLLPPAHSGALADVLIRLVLAQVSSHLLVHGAALGGMGKGILLAGPSGSGKTTLSLQLHRMGFRLLSDETGAVAVDSHLLCSFPRTVVHPALEGNVLFTEENASLPLGYLFLLPDGDEQTRETVVLCDRMPLSLVDDLRSSGFGPFSLIQNGDGCPGFTCAGGLDIRQFEEVERFCRMHGVAVVDVLESVGPADFSQPPVLSAISSSQAALALMRHLQNGFRSRLLGDVLGGNPALLYALVARSLSGVACYRLRSGDLSTTANLLCRVIG